MPLTLALIAAIALSVCSSAAFSQTAPPPKSQPAGQSAQDVGGTSDDSIRQAVISALNADPHHFFRHVNVRVDNGVATLSGFVHSSSSIFRARTIASGVPGVTRVLTSNLTLE